MLLSWSSNVKTQQKPSFLWGKKNASRQIIQIKMKLYNSNEEKSVLDASNVGCRKARVR